MTARNEKYLWEQKKIEIKNLYVDKGYTLKELQAHFKTADPQFNPRTTSERAFKIRLKAWGFQKYKQNKGASPKEYSRPICSSIPLDGTDLARSSLLRDSVAVPGPSIVMSHTILSNTPVDRDQVESQSTVELANDALLLVESLNKLAQHGFRIIHHKSTPKAEHVERLAENPGHAIWLQYLKQKNALSPLQWCFEVDYFQGEDKTYVHYILVTRICRWLTAMHDRAEQYREASPQLCHERHALILSTILRVWDPDILTYQFPRLIGILSSAAQFDMHSRDRQLEVLDQFLEIVKMSRVYVDLGNEDLNQLFYVPEDVEPLSRIQAYMHRLDSSALENQVKLLHTMEQVRVMIRHHFPDITGNDFRTSMKSTISFLSDVRDAEFPGLIGLFFQSCFLKWMGMLLDYFKDLAVNKTGLWEIIYWLYIERLFTLKDEFVRTRRAASDMVSQHKWDEFYFFLDRFGGSSWVRDSLKDSENRSANCDTCRGWCNVKKKHVVDGERLSRSCARGWARRMTCNSGMSISRLRTIAPSEHWCQCCMDEIGDDQLCGRTFEPCCKGHMNPQISPSEDRGNQTTVAPAMSGCHLACSETDSDISESDLALTQIQLY
ncbi:hypothetical protein BDZ91DRAFT_785666 [Kalaharituber pfeilii]|nr:hypothetical protein BDZ91DRAFT_785666 [Kalaharituber pfeilii]